MPYYMGLKSGDIKRVFKEIITTVGEEETRVAVLENKVLVEMYIERAPSQRLVGSIYKGRVENVLPGMQAAFVDIGLEKNAFLYVEDAMPSRPLESADSTALGYNICDILKQGQEIIVQIVKEPIGSKGARITTHITLPGRYLVLMPNVDYVGISRRIENEKERERLREMVSQIKPANMGIIVRTVAVGVEVEELHWDINMLTGLWTKIANQTQNTPAPNLLHRDLELVQRILRDIFTEDVDRLIIDSYDEYQKILDLLDGVDYHLKGKVFFIDNVNLFEENNINQEIGNILKNTVWLKCGGYIVIDQAEALTAIDVNTGKYVGSTNLEDTVLKTNLDAAVEIARQLRLRNIGGIIIVDFIDMGKEEHQQQVLSVFEEEISKDKTKTNLLGITQLGLVEMTRKKVRPSLSDVLQKTCPYCEGKGKVLSEETVGINVRQQICQLAKQTGAGTILVEANPLVAARLIGSGGANLRELEAHTAKKLFIRGSADQHIEMVTISPIYDQADIKSNNMPVKPGQVLEVQVEEQHINNHEDGISRINGFVLDIEGAGKMVGETVAIEIDRVFRTYARAKLIV